MKKQAGFTMIEIMIAVAIIGFLSITVGQKILGYLTKAKITQAKTMLGGLKGAIMDYTMAIGHPPTKKEGGLQALVEKPRDPVVAAKWKESFLVGDVPQDPWGFDFEYNCPPVVHKKYKRFEVFSRGEKNDEEDPELAAGE